MKQERTGWRDERISQLHRRFGFDCPAVDLDFILAEYDRNIPIALIEYKHEKAIWSPSNSGIKVISKLGTMANIPAFVTVYSDDLQTFTITSLNAEAKNKLHNGAIFNLQCYVVWLYSLRGRVIPENILKELGE